MVQKRNISTFLKNNWVFLITILYVLSPVDIIPDILPGVGTIDDTLLLIAQLLIEYGKYKKGNTEKT